MKDFQSVRMGYTPKPRFREFGGVRARAQLPIRIVPRPRSGGILSSTEVTKNGASFGSPSFSRATAGPLANEKMLSHDQLFGLHRDRQRDAAAPLGNGADDPEQRQTGRHTRRSRRTITIRSARLC
jgi:hypothetical protein